MSISPAEMAQQLASIETAAASNRSTPSPSASIPGSPTGGAQDVAASPSRSSATAPASQLSTDLRIDQEHQLYYEVVDDSTGSVVFEIPPEALRAIGESLNVPPNGDSSASAIIDLKS
jgi:hypothetical protein